MGIRIDKPWQQAEASAALLGQLGVFELCDADNQVIYIGQAGGRALFGLRSEVTAAIARTGAWGFRVEVNHAYHTRRLELLMVHAADHGRLPRCNAEEPPERLGRLSPG